MSRVSFDWPISWYEDNTINIIDTDHRIFSLTTTKINLLQKRKLSSDYEILFGKTEKVGKFFTIIAWNYIPDIMCMYSNCKPKYLVYTRHTPIYPAEIPLLSPTKNDDQLIDRLTREILSTLRLVIILFIRGLCLLTSVVCNLRYTLFDGMNVTKSLDY